MRYSLKLFWGIRLYAHLFIIFCLSFLLTACGGKQSGPFEPVALPEAPQAVTQGSGASDETRAMENGQKPSYPSVLGSPASPGGSAPLAAGQFKADTPVGKMPYSASDLNSIPVCWRGVAVRLATDGVALDLLVPWFVSLGDTYSDGPMGTKLKELFQLTYMPKPPRVDNGKPVLRIYSSFANPEIVRKCRDFLDMHAGIFALAEERYGVPKEVIVSLLMVETKLGGYTGKKSAFWSLACMASADSPERVPDTLSVLPVRDEHMPWVEKTLMARSDWAYKELRSLLTHCSGNAVDPLSMPGSVYGAVGLCQFMPSNISKFGADGDNDGRIDLFSVPDAACSVGNYLKQHGWRPGLNNEQRVDVLKKYNKSTPYANTIMYLATELTLLSGQLSDQSSAKLASIQH